MIKKVGLCRLGSVVAVGALIGTPGVATGMPANAATGDAQINIVDINDFHGRLVENDTEWTSVHLAAKIDDEVKANASTVFLSAGDNIGASTYVSSASNDNPTIGALNAMGLAASTVGNHEFDQGIATLQKRIDGTDGYTKTDFPYLGANVYDKETGNPVLPEYKNIELTNVPLEGGGTTNLTLGVVGVVTPEVESLVSPAGIADLTFGDPVDAANRAAAESKADPTHPADVVVLLVHDGATESESNTTLADQIALGTSFSKIITDTSADISAIFSGHTHKTYAWNNGPIPGSTTDTRPIIQTGEYGANYGKVTLDVNLTTKQVSSHTVANVAVGTTPAQADILKDCDVDHPDTATYPRACKVYKVVEPAKDQSDKEGRTPVGSTAEAITRATTSDGKEDRGAESAAGHLMATVLLDGTKGLEGRPQLAADIGIMNPGGLRADLPAGTITKADAVALAPFANQLFTVTLKGSSIKKILEQQWQPDGSSRPYLQLGLQGLTYQYDPERAKGDHIIASTIMVNGAVMDPNASYKVATNSFLAYGGDNFTAFTEGTWQDTGLVDLDALLNYLKANPNLKADNTPRATLYVEPTPPPAPTPSATATVTLSPSTATVGTVITVTGQAFGASEQISVLLASTPTTVATVTTDASGAFTAKFAVPSSLALGKHTVTATGATSGLSASATLDVVGDLSNTGTNSAGYAALGAAAALLGGVLLLLRRKHALR